jgi:hypothetical protein
MNERRIASGTQARVAGTGSDNKHEGRSVIA